MRVVLIERASSLTLPFVSSRRRTRSARSFSSSGVSGFDFGCEPVVSFFAVPGETDGVERRRAPFDAPGARVASPDVDLVDVTERRTHTADQRTLTFDRDVERRLERSGDPRNGEIVPFGLVERLRHGQTGAYSTRQLQRIRLCSASLRTHRNEILPGR